MNTDHLFTCWDVVSVERCRIQEMKSSLASSLTSSMLMINQTTLNNTRLINDPKHYTTDQ